MHWSKVVLAALALMVLAWGAAAEVGKGAEQIRLPGGKQGPVPFPHHRHQQALDDCMGCHTVFPQAAGSITQAKSDGKLAPKQVMNTLCIQCHRDRKQAGQASGPVGCVKCHVKE